MPDGDESTDSSTTLYFIEEAELLALLTRAHQGESPQTLLIEIYVNAEEPEIEDGECT